jgi:hypothetical protein
VASLPALEKQLDELEKEVAEARNESGASRATKKPSTPQSE